MINSASIFVDTSGFKAVFDKDDDFHSPAIKFWRTAQLEKIHLITSNFILDETYTLLRSHMGKDAALSFRQDIFESIQQLKIIRIIPQDEAQAWKYFEKLPGRGVSFTDCTSFSIMKRLKLETAFTFDNDFATAGFTISPGVQ